MSVFVVVATTITITPRILLHLLHICGRRRRRLFHICGMSSRFCSHVHSMCCRCVCFGPIWSDSGCGIVNHFSDSLRYNHHTYTQCRAIQLALRSACLTHPTHASKPYMYMVGLLAGGDLPAWSVALELPHIIVHPRAWSRLTVQTSA